MNKYVAASNQICIDAHRYKTANNIALRNSLFENIKKLANILYFVRTQCDKFSLDYIVNRKNMLRQDISMFKTLGQEVPQSMTDALELCDGCIALHRMMIVH